MSPNGNRRFGTYAALGVDVTGQRAPAVRVWVLIRAAAESLSREGRSRFTRQDIIRRVLAEHPNVSSVTIQGTIQSVTIGAPSKPSRSRPSFLRRVAPGVLEYSPESSTDDLRGQAQEPAVRRTATGLTRHSEKTETAARRIDELKASFVYYLEAYDRDGPFRREKQLNLHQQTIRLRRELGSVSVALNDDEFMASLNGVLRAWGIGNRGSRLAEPAALRTAFRQHLAEIQALEGLLISQLTDPGIVIDQLWHLVSTIPIVDNKSRIVPVTKALHHLLPDLVVPIDRAWTGAFFDWNMIEFDKNPERVFRAAYEGFVEVAKAVRPERFVDKGWRSSPTKIIDNGVVGFCIVNRIQPTSGKLPTRSAGEGELLSDRFDQALQMASDLHRAQSRKGSEARPIPYLAHVLSVVALVLADEPTEDVAIAAALHDGPEDCGGRPVLDAIRAKFGARVTEIVEACTDTFEQPKPDWIPRKKAYLAKLVATTDRQVQLVKCADCLANARDTLTDYRADGSAVWHRFKKMPCATNQVWWYESCRDALEGVSATRVFHQLDEVVNQLSNEVEPCPGCDYPHLQRRHISGSVLSPG